MEFELGDFDVEELGVEVVNVLVVVEHSAALKKWHMSSKGTPPADRRRMVDYDP